MGKRKVLEARTNSKILWNFTNDIAGKTKGKEVATYIYTEDGEKKELEVIWVQFVNTWKNDIYKKMPECH